MKSKVILFCILLFCSKIVDSIPHSEDLLRQRVYPLSNWQVEQNAEDSQDAQYLHTEFTPTRNLNPLTIPAIQPDSIQDYYSNQGRYNYDGYEYNKSPVASPLEKQLLGNYNTQVNGRRSEPRVESYPSQVGFDSQQFRKPHWRSQNQYTNYPSNGILITDSERPLVNTVQEPYRGPVQNPQPKYLPSSSPRFSQPHRSPPRREKFQYPLADNAGDEKYVANSAYRVGSNGHIPFENFNDGQAETSEIKARLIGDQRHTQSFSSQSGIIYKDSPDTHSDSTDTLDDQRKDTSDLSNTAQINNYDDGSPAISSADNYRSGSRTSNIRVPNEIYAEAQAAESEVKPIPIGSRRYVKNITPQIRPLYNYVPDVIPTDILADQSKTIKSEKRENYKSRSDSSNIAPITNQEDNTNTVSEPSNPTAGNIEKKVSFDISKILSDKPLARRYTHNYRPKSGSSYIARDDPNNGASAVIPETIQKNSFLKEPFPINTYSGPFPASTDIESDVSSRGSSSSIPSNTHVDHKPSSGITELSLVNLLSNTDIEKFMTGNTKRFLIIHPNKTVEYVDNIGTDSHQNSKFRVLNTQPKNLEMQFPENAKDKPIDETDSKLPIEDLQERPSSLKALPLRRQQVNSGSLKPLSKSLTPLVNQAGNDDVPYKSLTYPENQPEEMQYFKPLRPNKRHPVHHYKSVYQPADNNNSSPSFPDEIQSENDKISKKLSSAISEDDIDSRPLRSHKKHRVHPNEPTTLHINKSENVDNSNPSYPEENQQSDNDKPHKIQPTDGNQLAFDNNSKPQPLNKHRPGDENDSNSSSPGKNQPADYRSSNPSLLEDNQSDNIYKPDPSRPFEKQASYQQKPKSAHKKQSEHEETFPKNNTGDDDIANSSYPDVNEPEDNIITKPLHSYEKQPKNDSKSTAPSNENPDSMTVSPTTPNYTTSSEAQIAKTHKHSHIRRKSTTSSPIVSSTTPSLEETSKDQVITISPIEQVTDNVSDVPPVLTSTSLPKPIDKSDTTEDENNEQGDNSANSSSEHIDSISDKLHSSTTTAYPSSSTTPTENTSGDKTTKETVENSTRKTKDQAVVSQRGKGKNDIQPDENEPEDNSTSPPLLPYEKQPTDDSKTTTNVGSKTDENPDSTTVSPTTPNYITSSKAQIAKTHKHRHIRLKTTTSSPIVSSTTPSLEETSEDKMISISPIESVTDNVSDVPPVSTSTTLPKPIKSNGNTDAIKDDNNGQDDNSANSSSGYLDNISDTVHTSTTTASPSSSTTLTDNTRGDTTTTETVENSVIKIKDKAVESGKEKNDIQSVQSAVYSSSELLDTNTDVPAESDIYSPVTTAISVQNDVNTGDASGDTLELEKTETDVTITISSNTDNDSEDDFITINVEVSGSAGSSGNDKSFLITVDTDDHSDGESETSLATADEDQSSDSKKDHNIDDGRGKNLEIDMSNIQGEPTMWIRTTNQDFIQKLTEKNDTPFDVVYFFNMVTQPVIEREKETTFYCNGTVVITIKETKYPNKDDSTPIIEKTVQTMQIEDYKQHGLESSSK